MMKKHLVDIWVKDLRESGAKQAQHELFNGKGYCCLGRFYIVLGVPFHEVEPGCFLTEEDDPSWDMLSQEFSDLVGMKSRSGVFAIFFNDDDGNEVVETTSLAELNDSGFTFFQIADMIEYFWDRL